MANINKLEATREWVNNWRKDNNVGPNVTPAKEIVPFKWMHPFLKKVESTGLQIADAPRRIKGSAPANVIWKAPHLDSPYIDKQIERGWQPLTPPGPKGPQLFPLAQISPTDTPRDLRIQDAVKRFGKDKKGNYKNPELLIQHLLQA